MAENYYDVLGVPKSASQDEIHKAYRKLARKFHPDLHDDPKDKDRVKQRFQQVQQAYDVLGDEEKRKKYDKFGADFEQMGGGNPFAGGQMPPGGMELDLSDLFAQMGGGGGRGRGSPLEGFFGGFPGGGGRRGPEANPESPPDLDIQETVTVPFNVAVLGGSHQLVFSGADGRAETLEVKIPKGIESGKKIRLKGKGRRGPRGVHGDLLIVIQVAAHPTYRRNGNNLLVKIPVTLFEALLGTKIELPTPQGTVTVTVPPHSNSGKVLRLRGLGVASDKQTPGDLLAEIEIVVPDRLSDTQRKQLEQLQAELGMKNPRTELIW